MRPFTYTAAASIEEAVRTYADVGPDARYVAGGTTLYDLMKLNVERPTHLIDIATIRGLDQIDSAGDDLRFGALTPMSTVAGDPATSARPVRAARRWAASIVARPCSATARRAPRSVRAIGRWPWSR